VGVIDSHNTWTEKWGADQWNRVQLAYCLGLLPKWANEALDKLGKIRNLFAHNLGKNFTDNDVQTICNALYKLVPNNPDANELFEQLRQDNTGFPTQSHPKWKFMYCLIVSIEFVVGQSKRVEHRRRYDDAGGK
jgi:hypothetical protein